MSTPKNLIDLLNQVFHRWLAFLGYTASGIVVQLTILTLTAATGNWFKRSTWSDWKQNRKEFTRILRAMALVWGVAFLICLATTLRDDWDGLEAKYDMLESENRALHHDLDTIQSRFVVGRSPDRISNAGNVRRERAHVVASQARQLFTDILSFKNLVDANRPMRVLYMAAPARTEATITSETQYEQSALLTFFAKFGDRIYQVKLSMGKQGVDTSTLDTHLAQLVNTQVLRLVALDLEGMAEQLDGKKAETKGE
jgi:hypothetical protein